MCGSAAALAAGVLLNTTGPGAHRADAAPAAALSWSDDFDGAAG
ncbi:glycoside hydrolase family 16 protein, partial [Streptomyces sp. SID1328]|nr:glycoside hydrolase family 16 protein [Streptomyces sp. SID1328]